MSAEPPPAYSEATASSSSAPASKSHLHPSTTHKDHNGIPASARRSMEDENRDLPTGWFRQYDDKEHHQFFVDTTVDPPRSIWHHPYDDSQYLNSLTPEARARIHSLHKTPEDDDSSDDDHHIHSKYLSLPAREEKSAEKKGLGRKLKDKITGSTHEDREERRKLRDEEERRIYEQHQKYRAAMSKAAQTGEPQFIGKDNQGKDVYIEPPSGGYGGYGQGGYGINPYQRGNYSMPNARYIRPQDPYSRPYGYGYGGGMYGSGYGYGGGLGLAGGLGGGLLLGSLLI